MIVDSQRRRVRLIVLLLSVSLIIIGSGSYFYFIKHKEPTNGIFVYHHIKGEGAVSGNLYQPT